MEVTRTSLRAQRNPIPKQVRQGEQTQQRGGYGEEVRQKLETLGDVRRESPVIKAKRVDPVVSQTEQYTKDAVKTAMEKLKKFIVNQGLGGDKPGDTEKPATFASTGGGGGGIGKKDFFSGFTNDQLGLLSTDQLVARDNRMYGNTVPEGSFGSGSLKTIQDSPGSAVDTNIARHVEGTSEDQPPTVKFEATKYGQGGLPLGTTTQRQGGDYGISGDGPAVNASGFQQKNVRGSTSFGGTGKDESARPKQTVAALPSNYKATEAEAFAKAKSYKDSVAKGKAAETATGIKTKPVAGSFGISEAGKKEAEANKKAAADAKAKADAKAAADKKAKQAEAKKKAEAAKKQQSTTKSSGRKSNTGSKKSSRGGKSGGGGSKGGGGTSKKSNTGSKKASRGAKGGGTSKGGSFGGKRRRSNTKKSRRRCDIRCKFDISILTNQNLIRDDLADVAYFVKDLQEIN
tara:strand:+ start:2683 stop:4059 length:1377 start_codon:yes stop_codon:yes gene_type:complete